MNLAIICGSLEQGKDGVGDYVQGLGRFLKDQGHKVLLCALNDSWVDARSEYLDPHRLRFPKTSKWPARFSALGDALANFQPDFVSLQFVPFAFHDRGLCHQLASGLRSLPSVKRWHIMFHELWLGLEASQPLKYKVLGFLQRRICLNLVKTLQPKLIHTHAAAYEMILRRENIAAKRLPLFSNITITPDPDYPALYQLLARNGSSLDPSNRSEKFIAVFFGALHPEWDPAVLMQKLHGRKIVFLAIGRLGETGQKIWSNFSKNYRDDAEFIQLGELTSEDVSAALQFADAGIAASPWNLIEKSGSAAAMIEHGLPVMVTRNDFFPAEHLQPGPSWRSRLYPVWDPDFDCRTLVKFSPLSNRDEVCRQFVDDLEAVIRQP